MSLQAVAWAISQQVGSPTGKALLLCLANYADEKGRCWPSQTTISNEAELSIRTARDWLAKLEQKKFIKRTPRFRADGSRTSDFIYLCFNRGSESPEESPPADSAGRPVAPLGDASPPGNSASPPRQELPGKEPATEPLDEPSRGASAPDGGFSKLWDDWPASERPNKRPVADRLFQRLSLTDRSKAVQFAAAYRARQKALGSVGLMIPYIKNRLFLEHDDAPSIDRDGDFVITPDREEWPAWLAAIRAEHGERAAASTERSGLIVRPMRWPGVSFASVALEAVGARKKSKATRV